MSATASAAQKQAFIAKSLYRNILRSAQPLIASPTHQCLLLHRTRAGMDAAADPQYVQLVSEVLAGQSYQFPTPTFVRENRLASTIRRGFQAATTTDLSVAFRALRELRSKREAMESLQNIVADSESEHIPTIDSVRSLANSRDNPIRPGTFLIAHPLLDGYFARSVILLLDTSTAPNAPYGAYGVMINRPCNDKDELPLTLAETVQPLPRQVHATFGNRPVREGGPVQVAVQFVYTATTSDSHSSSTGSSRRQLGGVRLPSNSSDTSPEEDASSVVYYKGDILRAAQSPPEQYNIFVGASCWAVGQLEDELAQGCWLPCSAPPTLALKDSDDDNLWTTLLASASTAAFARAAQYVSADMTTPCDWAR